MTNRARKWTVLSALWMLCAFIAPTFAANYAALCSSPAPFLQCSQSGTSSLLSHREMACCKNARDGKRNGEKCCLSNQKSAPRDVASVASSQHRVLDVALDAFVAAKPRFICDAQRDSFVVKYRSAREKRFASVEHPPPSGRAPPAVWS